MKRDIADFVAKFLNCQHVKVEHQKPGGMTQEINIPTWKWEVINMDFITGLPHTLRKHDSIWVIVNRVTKSAHFLVVKTTYLMEDYAKLYINKIVRLHGVPLSIISDRGPHFTSHLWRSFHKGLGTYVNLRYRSFSVIEQVLEPNNPNQFSRDLPMAHLKFYDS
ncbi:hypothetical protein MTR67_043021 [Solanum verrucosum]|uniref:Integrase catalytic domain-containing protein n=1 Tax=Solanum verrucosum TaxID=315347 RepID=A0AAF0ZSB0_SOLVR|nr:hypothetical protein MTR67_043021 [Solanum verrucosum]